MKTSLLDAVFKYGIRPRELPPWADGAIVLALFIGFAIWGTEYWQRTAAPNQPFYYQLYFEPAVMVACGKGYVVSSPQLPAIAAFLQRRVDHFSCADIPPDAHLTYDEVYQTGSWRYLLDTVGYTWRVLGISWSGLGPFFGTMFGATMALLYAIFRLAMGPLLAVSFVVAIRFSILQLKYLPHLRDYAKAPFTLLLIALLGALVLGRLTWQRTLALAAAYGAVLGIGYGFRSDLLVDIAPFLVALAFFVPGGVFRNLGLKAAAVAVFILAFFATTRPVFALSANARPGCLWHVVAMGFAQQFDPALGVRPAPYEVSREYLDEWVYTTVTSAAARVRPGVGHIEYCGAAYGDATRAYLIDIVKRFPADVIVRSYASILRVLELPFAPVPGIDDEVERPPDAADGHRIGLALVTAAVVVAIATDLRLGLFLLFFVIYFGGTPAIQFDHRHFFHLEFITWWAAAFLLQGAITRLPAIAREHAWKPFSMSLLRAAGVLAACLIALAATLWAARAYQQPIVRSVLADYLAAPREPVPLAGRASIDADVRAAPRADPETADFVAVDINGSACGEHPRVTFQYEDSRRPYGRTFEVPRQSHVAGLSHIFIPIYDGFRQIAFSDAPPGCVVGVYRVRDAGRFPMLLEVVLRPGWRREPLYQRLATFF